MLTALYCKRKRAVAEGQGRPVEGMNKALIKALLFSFCKGKNELSQADRISRGLLYYLK